MADIFLSNPGQVQVIPDVRGIPVQIVIRSGKTIFQPFAAILTDIATSQGTRQQFMMSLRQAVYAYIFGDHMGSLTLSGISFASRCGGYYRVDATTGYSNQSGFEEIQDFYDANRASVNNDTVQVTIGSRTYNGFLIDLAQSTVSSDIQFLISRWRMTLNTLPRSPS